MIMGFFVTARTARVTAAAVSGAAPKAAPPPWTLGQEILTSIQPTCASSSSRRQTSVYSSMEKPLTLAITGLWKISRSRGSSWAITASMPGFCRPTAFSRPPAYSAMRGVGFPNRGSRVVPLKENVPSILMS